MSVRRQQLPPYHAGAKAQKEPLSKVLTVGTTHVSIAIFEVPHVALICQLVFIVFALLIRPLSMSSLVLWTVAAFICLSWVSATGKNGEKTKDMFQTNN
jgi:hypothetical protein